MKYGTKVIDDLADAGIPVIFRPHPQFKVSHKVVLAEIERKYKGRDIVTMDFNQTAIQSMVDSDILIADISGVVFDYAYLFNRPVILTSSKMARGGYEVISAEDTEWTIPALKELSTELDAAAVSDLPSFVTKVRSDRGEYSRIEQFRNNNLYNFGNAGEAAANAIMKIVSEI